MQNFDRSIPRHLEASCLATAKSESQDLDIEWIADTRSSKGELGTLKSSRSRNLINIISANGPSAAEIQSSIAVPSLGIVSRPCVLPSNLVLLQCFRLDIDAWKKALSLLEVIV